MAVSRKQLGTLSLCLGLSAGYARADDVHLEGGSVLEGKAVRHADKVTVELESGSITLDADSVRRIDKRESSVQRFERSYAALAPADNAGRMQLANYCREHDMRARERSVLQEVIDRDPEHAQARARLGYVRGPQGWITLEEQYRAQGLVKYDGVWMPSERAAALERRQAEAQIAERERERARLQLETERTALARQQAENERAQLQPAPYDPSGYYARYGYGHPRSRVLLAPQPAPVVVPPPPPPPPPTAAPAARSPRFVMPRAPMPRGRDTR